MQRSACSCRKEGGVLRCLSASEQISSPPSVTRVDWHSKDFALAVAAAHGEIPALLCSPFSRVTFCLSLKLIPKCKPRGINTASKLMLHSGKVLISTPPASFVAVCRRRGQINGFHCVVWCSWWANSCTGAPGQQKGCCNKLRRYGYTYGNLSCIPPLFQESGGPHATTGSCVLFHSELTTAVF